MPEETLEVRLRSTETQSTYNIVVEVEGVIDVHYASLTLRLQFRLTIIQLSHLCLSSQNDTEISTLPHCNGLADLLGLFNNLERCPEMHTTTKMAKFRQQQLESRQKWQIDQNRQHLGSQCRHIVSHCMQSSQPQVCFAE